MTITYQSAVLFVKDIAAARHFYETRLGQEVDIDFGPNVGFKAGFALWAIDHVNQMVFERTESGDTPRLGRENCELYFECADPQAVEAELRAAGVSFVHGLREHPWGQRVIRVYDPDGHIVELGEAMPLVIKRLLDAGGSVESVTAQTGMPLELIRYVAEHGDFPPQP